MMGDSEPWWNHVFVIANVSSNSFRHNDFFRTKQTFWISHICDRIRLTLFKPPSPCLNPQSFSGHYDSFDHPPFTFLRGHSVCQMSASKRFNSAILREVFSFNEICIRKRLSNPDWHSSTNFRYIGIQLCRIWRKRSLISFWRNKQKHIRLRIHESMEGHLWFVPWESISVDIGLR
jgi:hypothetical protein